jgi:hypothetical protein
MNLQLALGEFSQKLLILFMFLALSCQLCAECTLYDFQPQPAVSTSTEESKERKHSTLSVTDDNSPFVVSALKARIFGDFFTQSEIFSALSPQFATTYASHNGLPNLRQHWQLLIV